MAIYLPLIPGGESPAPPAAGAHNPTVQGPVERPRAARQAATPAPAPAPPPAAVPALAAVPQAATTTDPGSTAERAPEQAPPAEQASAAQAAPAAEEPEPAPEAAPAPAAEPMFQVQVGAFREVARAQKLSRRLTRAGFPTSVMRGTTPDGKLIFRVRTRQALPKAEARQLVARLRHRVPALRPILVPGGEAAG